MSSGLVMAQGEDFYYDVDVSTQPTTEVGEFLHDEVIDQPQSFVQRVLRIFGLEQYASGTTPETGETLGATNFIQRIVNYALALAAFIALVVIIRGFAQMLFSEEEE